MNQNHKSKILDEQILECYNSGMNMHKTASQLNMTNVTLWRRAKKIGIAWTELKNISGKKIPLHEILDGLHPYYQTFKLKNRLIKENIKENICDVCGISEWNGIHINMQLDHIDGDSHNHLLSNLRMICPNCHSQTETYCGKNIE
jgi:hypothetical protein